MNSPLPRVSASTNFGTSAGATPMSESRISTTSPRDSAKPRRTASPLPRPVCLRKRSGSSGCAATSARITASVSSVELPSTNRNSLPCASAGRLSTSGRMWPASLRHGITTLTEGAPPSKTRARAGEGRATIPNISESWSTSGRWPR